MKITKTKIIVIAAVVIIAAALFFGLRKKGGVEYVTAKVERGDLVQTVSETGAVKAAKEIELSFLQAGKVGKILTVVGQKAIAGQILAELDYGSLSIQEKEAQASLEAARADLNKVLSGATSQEVAVSQANVKKAEAAYLSAIKELEKIEKSAAETVSQAQKTLDDLESPEVDTPQEYDVATAKNSLENTKDTYQQVIDNKIDTALLEMDGDTAVANTALDNIDRVLNDDDARSVFSIKDTTYKTKTQDAYEDAQVLADAADNILVLAKAKPTSINVGQGLDDFLSYLNKVYDSLNYCYKALENTVVSSSFTQAELDALKTNISTQLTAVSAGISGLQTADQNLNTAILSYDTNVAGAEDGLAEKEEDLKNAILTAENSLATAEASGEKTIAAAKTAVNNGKEAWAVAKAQLDELKAPARKEDLSLYRAKVSQAEANLELIKKKIEDSIIKAPINGTVTKVEYEAGEQISATMPAINILGENNYEIEVDISEADISKVSAGNQTEITLDAFGDDVKFKGDVYFIEPAETVIQDVIYYKVKIRFADDTNLNEYETNLTNIKSGMTANVIITTAKKENVLLAPARAIVEKNGDGKYVRILKDGQAVEAPITVGLRGDEGMVEVLSGLEEGQEVVTQVKESE